MALRVRRQPADAARAGRRPSRGAARRRAVRRRRAWPPLRDRPRLAGAAARARFGQQGVGAAGRRPGPARPRARARGGARCSSRSGRRACSSPRCSSRGAAGVARRRATPRRPRRHLPALAAVVVPRRARPPRPRRLARSRWATARRPAGSPPIAHPLVVLVAAGADRRRWAPGAAGAALGDALLLLALLCCCAACSTRGTPTTTRCPSCSRSWPGRPRRRGAPPVLARRRDRAWRSHARRAAAPARLAGRAGRGLPRLDGRPRSLAPWLAGPPVGGVRRRSSASSAGTLSTSWPSVGDDDQVLDPDADGAGHVDAGLHGHDVAGASGASRRAATAAAPSWTSRPTPCPSPWPKCSPWPAAVDDVAGDGVDLAAGRPRRAPPPAPPPARAGRARRPRGRAGRARRWRTCACSPRRSRRAARPSR